jgi:hypothetical protein
MIQQKHHFSDQPLVFLRSFFKKAKQHGVARDGAMRAWSMRPCVLGPCWVRFRLKWLF